MIVDCARYRSGARDAEGSTTADAARLSHDGAGFAWLALSRPTPQELAELGELLEVPALAVEDALADHQRPVVASHGDWLLVVVRRALYDDTTEQLDVGQVGLLVGERCAVGVDLTEGDVLDRVRRRIDQHPELTALGTPALVWAVLDTVVDGAERVLDLLIDRPEQIEQAVFQEDRDQSEAIYLHHRQVDRLGRAVHPVLATLDSLERGDPTTPDGVRLALRGVADRARRLSEEVVLLSGRLEGLLSANLSRVTVRQNVIVQQVSAWAAIAAAPTIVAGVYGMNFRHFPELGWPFGYPFALAVMVTAVAVLHWNFRRAGWL